MKRICTAVFMLVALCSVFWIGDAAQAQSYRRSYGQNKFGGARPVTGFGSNLHRRYILERESRRASQGKPVRNRGNIRWYR